MDTTTPSVHQAEADLRVNGASSMPCDDIQTGAAGDDDGEGEPEALGLGAATAPLRSLAGGDVRDVALTGDGLVVAADVDKGLRLVDSVNGRKLSSWQYERRAKGHGKRGIVSSVCVLADGRVAVSIINQRRVVLLRRPSPVGGDGSSGDWVEDHVAKLDTDPYRVDAHRLWLAIVGTTAQARRIGPIGSSSKWGPGPCIQLVPVPSAGGGGGSSSTSAADAQPPRKQLHTLDYEVLSVALTGRALVVASSSAQKVNDSLWSYVVDAYERPSGGESSLRRLWRSEFDEQVQDVCAVPAKGALYVALPDSRRVLAISSATGDWLVDVLSGGPSRPLRVHALSSRAQQQRPEDAAGGGGCAIRAVVLYADSSVTVHPVGQVA